MASKREMEIDMREIKFRAWDKEKKQWIPPYPEAFWIIGETTMFDCLKQYRIKDFDNIEVMQYTGLKDKNGKEIYESDKVRYATGDPDNPFIVEEVYFGEGAFYPVCTQPGETFEVIGNVYESNTKIPNY